MGRSLKLGAAALLTFVCCAAAAWGQVSAAPEAKSGDPLNALWSLLGSGGAAGVLYLWAKSERDERREMAKSLLGLFTADAENKTAIRERLKGQDDLLVKVLDEVRSLSRRSSSSQPGGKGD
jgi:hypothetical protein